MSQDIDNRIKKAQRKGIGVFFVTGIVTVAVITAFLLWLFFIKAYTIIVGPQDAQLTSQISVSSGLAFVHKNTLYSLSSTTELKISAETFQTATVSIDDTSPATVEIVLLPLPAEITANLIIDEKFENTSTDVSFVDTNISKYLESTQWYLNGQLQSVGSTFQHSAAPGLYQLVAQNPYFYSKPLELSLQRAQKRTVEISLLPAMGSLALDSEPSGARVSINNVETGKTPLQVSVQTGDYKILIDKEGMQTVEELIPVKITFLDQKRNYKLEPLKAILNVKTNPEGGTLLINNIEYPAGKIFLDANKTHNIEYSKAGYSTFSKKVKLDLEKPPTLIDIELQKTFGILDITSNVPASVSVNGKPRGNAPLQLSLNTVPQLLEFTQEGYRSVKMNLTPKAFQTTPLEITMLTEFDARRKEGKPLFVDQLGITMFRFAGTPFTMGSPPNETGRRRNEHEIKVEFRRQFLISNKEITKAQFSAFTGNNAVQSNLPVTDITWIEAARFCNWLSEQEGLPVFYRFVNNRYAGINENSRGYRLPTEAEWEWLAKKSRRTVSTVYVWGNQTQLRDNQGNYADKSTQGSQLIFFEDYSDGYSGLAPVGSFKPDRSGIYDLDGNVSEWVHDFYTTSLPDTSKLHVDYKGSPSGETWVIKGGNFESGRLRELRAAFREFSNQGNKKTGFRIARYYD